MEERRWKVEDRIQKIEKEETELGLNDQSFLPVFRLSIFFLLTSFFLLPSFAYAEELKDVKPPVGLPETPWLLIAAIVLGVVLTALGLWFWLRSRRDQTAKVEIKTPWDVAYERLQDLRRRDLFGQGKAQEHFIELSAIARAYIEERFNIRAPEMTTEEFLDSVKNASNVEPKHKEILQNFLRLCDMVKFAKYGPSAQEAIHSFELVKRFVDETKIVSPPPGAAQVTSK